MRCGAVLCGVRCGAVELFTSGGGSMIPMGDANVATVPPPPPLPVAPAPASSLCFCFSSSCTAALPPLRSPRVSLPSFVSAASGSVAFPMSALGGFGSCQRPTRDGVAAHIPLVRVLRRRGAEQVAMPVVSENATMETAAAETSNAA